MATSGPSNLAAEWRRTQSDFGSRWDLFLQYRNHRHRHSSIRQWQLYFTDSYAPKSDRRISSDDLASISLQRHLPQMTFLTEAWFWRGTQSAIFYYLSCAPCSKIAYQRRKRKDAKRAKAERDLAGTFQQPLPSGTNPYWNEEITLGPGPPPKRAAKEKGKRGNRKLRFLDKRNLESAAGQSGVDTGNKSLDTTNGQIISPGLSRTSGREWNCRRYQREDETLWGHESIEAEYIEGLPSFSRSGSHNSNYYYARNPEVNELHPPVVSTRPTSRNEIKWVLQPPPKAKVMAGKEHAKRGRSESKTSGGSSLASRGSHRRAGGENLGTVIGERLLEEKKARGEGHPPTTSSHSMSRGSPRQSLALAIGPNSTVIQGQRHDRDEDTPPSGRLESTVSPSPVIASSDQFVPTTRSTRPPLSTIPPSSARVPQSRSHKAASQHPRPALVSAKSASSLNPLQKLMSKDDPKSNSENRRLLPLLDMARTTKLPSATMQEENELKYGVDGWQLDDATSQSCDFRLSTVNVQIGHRWSMDI